VNILLQVHHCDTDYGHFTYETLCLRDSSPNAFFAYHHHINKHPAIHMTGVCLSIVITQFLLYNCITKCIN